MHIRIKEQLSLFSHLLGQLPLSVTRQLILLNLPCNNVRPALVVELAEETSRIFGIPFCQMQHGPKIKKVNEQVYKLIKYIL